MVCMAIERHPSPPQMRKGTILPVIGMGVRQEDGTDSLPRLPNDGEAMRQLAWSNARINKQTEVRRLDQTGIAAAAAGECGET